jgi:ATP-dependent DNA ligase
MVDYSVGPYRDIRRRATGVPRPPGPGENRDVLPPYAPMIPTPVRRPFHREGWIDEEKIDDLRTHAYKDGRTVRLESRNGVDHTRRFRG